MRPQQNGDDGFVSNAFYYKYDSLRIMHVLCIRAFYLYFI